MGGILFDPFLHEVIEALVARRGVSQLGDHAGSCLRIALGQAAEFVGVGDVRIGEDKPLWVLARAHELRSHGWAVAGEGSNHAAVGRILFTEVLQGEKNSGDEQDESDHGGDVQPDGGVAVAGGFRSMGAHQVKLVRDRTDQGTKTTGRPICSAIP